MKVLAIVAIFVAAGKFREQLVYFLLLKLLTIYFFFNAAMANPLPSDEDWQLISGGEGDMHLVDINASAEDVESMFTPASDVTFTLFTSSWLSGQRIILNNAASLSSSRFNPSNPTRILIHGWQQNGGASFNSQTRARYHTRGSFNVIVVDWGAGAQTINYALAAGRVRATGGVVGDFIDFLNLRGGATFASINVIGFSLGAHVAGHAGKQVTRGRLPVVVGCDPAGPSFSWLSPSGRLSSGDATYVLTIHTDIGRLGFDRNIGDGAFYPNMGRGHPGCGLDFSGTCGHDRSWIFFGESIANPSGFFGTRCSGWSAIDNGSCPRTGTSAAMGGEPVHRSTGVFFMPTNGAAPFGQGFRP